jgi:O-antigen/teichoic acid export membrane protein
MLGPAELGTGAFVLSIVTQGAVLGDLGLSITGVRALGNSPENRDEYISIVFGIRLRIAVLLSALMVVLAWIFRPAGGIGLWLLACPLLVVTVLGPQWVFQGLEKIAALNVIQLLQTLLCGAMYIGLFRAGARATLYVTVALVTQAASWIISYVYLRRYVRVRWARFNWPAAWKMVCSSGYAFAIVVVVFLYTGLEIPLITLLMSPTDAGVFRAAQGMVGILAPILTIAGAIIYPRLIAWKNVSTALFVRNTKRLVFICVAMAISIDVAALAFIPMLFRMLFGSRFIAGVTPCIVLIVAKSLVLISTVPAWGLIAFGLERKQLMVAICAGVVSVTLNLLLIPRFGIIAAATTNAVSELTIAIASSLWLLVSLKAIRAEETALRGSA